MRIVLTVLTALAFLLWPVHTAWAEVIITPNEAVIGRTELFTVIAATEKGQLRVTEVRVEIPAGIDVQSVEPKAGWRVLFEREGEDENGRMTEITWRGGRIDPGELERFVFLAQISGESSLVSLPALQVHSNGSVTKWTGEDEGRPTPQVHLVTRSIMERLDEDVTGLLHAQPVIRIAGFRTTMNTWAAVIGIILGGAALYVLYQRTTSEKKQEGKRI